MRTTVQFDADVAKAIEELLRNQGGGVSAAVNELIRRGLANRPSPARFRQRAVDLGLAIDVSNVAEALEVLESPTAR